MNKKQLASMWAGIILIVLPLFGNIFFVDDYLYSYSNSIFKLSLWAISVVLVTGGLIYTFRDKKQKDKHIE